MTIHTQLRRACASAAVLAYCRDPYGADRRRTRPRPELRQPMSSDAPLVAGASSTTAIWVDGIGKPVVDQQQPSTAGVSRRRRGAHQSTKVASIRCDADAARVRLGRRLTERRRRRVEYRCAHAGRRAVPAPPAVTWRRGRTRSARSWSRVALHAGDLVVGDRGAESRHRIPAAAAARRRRYRSSISGVRVRPNRRPCSARPAGSRRRPPRRPDAEPRCQPDRSAATVPHAFGT